MAGVMSRKFHCILKTSSSSFWWSKCPSMSYSVYAPNFKEPILDKEKVDKLYKEMSEEEILSTKVKAAATNMTCSYFYHPDVEKFVSFATKCGKKDVAREGIRNAFTRIKHIQLRKYNNETDEEKKKDILISPLEVFLLAVKNVSPMMWFIRIKRSGTWYRVPVGISEIIAKKKGMKWILECTNDKPSKVPFEVQLAKELIDAAHYEGKGVAKKIEMHKLCEANRGYANYWWV